MVFKMDVKTNQGLILSRKEVEVDSTGVKVELHFKDVSYSLSEQGAYEYIRRTMIANPTVKSPSGTPPDTSTSSTELIKAYLPSPKRFYPTLRGYS